MIYGNRDSIREDIMDKEKIRELLEALQQGDLDIDAAMARLKNLPYEDLGFARIDTHRSMRRGFPEVIYCEHKTPEQIRKIVEAMLSHNRVILGMRAGPEVPKALEGLNATVRYHVEARAVVIGEMPEARTKGSILVISAGTADIPVAEEAALTARAMGNPVDRLYDVGVAGVHRLLGSRDKLFAARVLVVVAGMEGALPGVVGGLVDRPVVAVPTSIGYGASFQGLSALLTMLSTCVPGVAVVNIDNGFGAGYLASMINRCGEEKP
jgi:NCAIR mutase (PurE)-related protein